MDLDLRIFTTQEIETSVGCTIPSQVTSFVHSTGRVVAIARSDTIRHFDKRVVRAFGVFEITSSESGTFDCQLTHTPWRHKSIVVLGIYKPASDSDTTTDQGGLSINANIGVRHRGNGSLSGTVAV